MRSLLSLVAFLAAALIAIALHPASPVQHVLGAGATGIALRPAPTGGSTARLARVWLLVSAVDGLYASFDDGHHWAKPPARQGETAQVSSPQRTGGALPRGSFFGLVADVARPGTAYLANGDVYATADGGQHWTRLPPVSASLGPAGVTVLAGDARADVLYAAGAGVLAYQPRQGWSVWGRGWHAGVQVTALLSSPGHGLYAAAGAQLYHATGAGSSWHRVTTPWPDAPITALALGPDGVTPFVAVFGATAAAGARGSSAARPAFPSLSGPGVWYIDRAGAPAHVSGAGLPTDARIEAMQSDATGGDLYVATDRGLYVRHQNATYIGLTLRDTWRQVLAHPHDPIVVLRTAGAGLLAVSQSGTMYEGRRGHGQALSWLPLRKHVPAGASPIVAALVGSEWQTLPPPAPLPAAFTQNCLRYGASREQAFDVCGPLNDFYLQFRYPVFGWPRERAILGRDGVVRQSFDNVRLEWTAQRGVYLAPLGQVAAGHRRFPRPSRAEVQRANTAYIAGYYVDPIFYAYWRQYLYHGASVFGPPISQRLREQSSDGTGRQVWVQYFRNARLEYRPYFPGAPVQLSNLGATVPEQSNGR